MDNSGVAPPDNLAVLSVLNGTDPAEDNDGVPLGKRFKPPILRALDGAGS